MKITEYIQNKSKSGSENEKQIKECFAWNWRVIGSRQVANLLMLEKALGRLYTISIKAIKIFEFSGFPICKRNFSN